MAPAGSGPTPVPTPRPARFRRWLPRVVFEALLIAASVLLGFALNEWGQMRARDERARQALAAIAVELDSNRVLAERARARHRARVDTIAVYMRRGATLPERVYLSGMFNPARVQSTAWDAARAGDALRALPYPLVLQLGRVYERQAQYRALSDDLIASVYGDGLRRGIAPVWGGNPEAWAILNSDFADRAGTLEEEYAAALARVRAARVR